MKERFLDCCIGLLTGDSGADNPDFLYVQILSRGGLSFLSTNLVNYVYAAFAGLEFMDDLITKSGLPVRKAAERVLIYCSSHSRHMLAPHMKQLQRKITNSTAVNIYFNSKRKIWTDSVATDGIKPFKKRQREKSSY